MIPRNIILLMSGGLDSVTLAYWFKGKGENVHALLVDYKQPHVQELLHAKAHCKRLGILWTVADVPNLGGLNDDSWIVPNRNAIFISLAVNLAVKAKADTVMIGCNEDDRDAFPDCRIEFIAQMNNAILAAGFNIEVCAPFLHWPKWRIGAMAKEIGVPTNDIWSCYRGGVKPCGHCPACEKLAKALA